MGQLRGLAALILSILLVACGPSAQQSAEPQAAQPTAQPLPSSPTAAPPTAVPPTAAPPTAEAAPTLAATVAATQAPAAAGGAIPTSRTAEGYHLLGDPAAPVTLVMYSDFL